MNRKREIERERESLVFFLPGPCGSGWEELVGGSQDQPGKVPMVSCKKVVGCSECLLHGRLMWGKMS